MPVIVEACVTAEQHGKCQYNCARKKGPMISCSNDEFSCENIAHSRCCGVSDEMLQFISIWFCHKCRKQSDDLESRWAEERGKLTAIKELADRRSATVAEELSKVMDDLEAKEADLAASREAVQKLSQELMNQQKREPVENSQQAPQTEENGDDPEQSETSERVDAIMQRARNRTHHPHDPSTLGLNHAPSRPRVGVSDDLEHQQRYATMIADAASSYPDYATQEALANALTADQLTLLRSHITDPSPFDGNVANWATFKTVFVGSSRRGHYRAIEDMERLRRLIGGDAFRMYGPEILEPFAHPTSILRKLDNFYGVQGNAVRHHLQSICHLPRISKSGDKEAILNLYATIKTYAVLCRQCNQIAELTAESSLLLIEGKMLEEHALVWRHWATMNHHVVGVDAILAFLEEQLRQLQQNPFLQTTSKGKSAQGHVFLGSVVTGGPSEAESSHAKSSKNGGKGTRKRSHKCFNCEEAHYFSECPRFLSAAADERLELTRRAGLCMKCLAVKRHKARECPRDDIKCPVTSCEIRNKHPLLHGHPKEAMKGSSFAGMHRVMAVAREHTPPVLFKVIPGDVLAANGERIPITMLIDTGSSISLSEMSLLKRAGWKGDKYELSMKWTSDIIRTEENACSHRVSFVPQGRNVPIVLEGITAINNLDLPEQAQDMDELRRSFPYLAKVPLRSFEVQRPQILLGLPHAWLTTTIQAVRDPEARGPSAEMCELGWTVSGPCGSLGIVSMQDPNVVGHSFVHAPAGGDEESVDMLIELIKQFFAQDSVGIKGKKSDLVSTDDRRALDLIESTLRFVPKAKRYEIGLLWRQDIVRMPPNYEMALNRLKAAEKRLQKLGLVDFMNNQFADEIEKGQLVKVSQKELSSASVVNYVPGFIVFNHNKIPPKPRWVNDTAAECQKISLNSKLMKGPDNLVPLPRVLCVLREGAIAVTADIKKMFNQILMKREDQYAQLCLWRDCDSAREPTIFRQTRVIFGPTCSPAAANAVRIRHAQNSLAKYPEAAIVARDQMYMDDAVDSRDSVDEMEKVSRDLIEMFGEISWELTQFQSNSRELLDRLPRDRVSDKMTDLSIEETDTQVTKVLGMFWDPQEDAFQFKLNDEKLLQKCLIAEYRPTRKEMISLVMRLFDPLGLLSHFLVHGRLALQEMCRQGLDWKDRVPDDVYEKWTRWLRSFEAITKLALPRRYAPVPLGECKITMHLFVDASKDAYACALYLRFEYESQVFVRLAAAKARVAPIKYMTIPKLELNSALIGARLLVSAKEWFSRLDIQRYTAWSDSITVLRWLYAKHIRYQQYVAPRIAEIQELTSVRAWQYVPTDKNVADIGTKWHEMDFSDASHVWFTGPQFLYHPPEEWPTLPEDFSRYITEESENGCVERVMVTKRLSESSQWQAGIFGGVSAKTRADWPQYTRVVALSVRFCKAIKSKSAPSKSRVVTLEEISEAENMIVRSIQRAAFPKEYALLAKGKGLPSANKLAGLSPFVCDKGIMRVRTRLSESFAYDTRYPKILPNLHETTDAIVNYFHLRHSHVGDNAIMGSIRTAYWIVSTRRAVRRARARCPYCIVKRAKPEAPEEAGLPEFRLDATKKAFYYTGVDCFGPFETYVGRSRHKRTVWMIIFTCLITRAVYLEIIEEMSTDCVSMALEKLWARRGPVGHMYSDNGRNFVGMANLLQNENFQLKHADKRLKWHFQPPYAPNFGGVWERLIKDIKRGLMASVGKFPVPRIVKKGDFLVSNCPLNCNVKRNI